MVCGWLVARLSLKFLGQFSTSHMGGGRYKPPSGLRLDTLLTPSPEFGISDRVDIFKRPPAYPPQNERARILRLGGYPPPTKVASDNKGNRAPTLRK